MLAHVIPTDVCVFLLSSYTNLTKGTGDFNPYRLGVTDFYGKGKTVDTSKPFTVVTQFLGSGSNLSEIKRYYVQGGKVIENPQPKTSGLTGNSITEAWCDTENKVHKEEVYPFKDHGGRYLFMLLSNFTNNSRDELDGTRHGKGHGSGNVSLGRSLRQHAMARQHIPHRC